MIGLLAQLGAESELIAVVLERYGLFGLMAALVIGVMWYSSRTIQRTQIAYNETQSTLAKISLAQQAQSEKQDARIEKLQAELSAVKADAARQQGVQDTLQKTLDSERIGWNQERSQMAAEIATLRETVRQHEKTIEQLKALIESKASENSQLRADKARLETQIEAKDTLVKELQARIVSLEKQLASQATLITQQSRDIEELKREKINLNQRLDDLLVTANGADGAGANRHTVGGDTSPASGGER